MQSRSRLVRSILSLDISLYRGVLRVSPQFDLFMRADGNVKSERSRTYTQGLETSSLFSDLPRKINLALELVKSLNVKIANKVLFGYFKKTRLYILFSHDSKNREIGPLKVICIYSQQKTI